MPTATEARANFKATLDSAEQGVTVPVERGDRITAMVDGARLRHTLSLLVTPDTQVFCENDEWNAYVPQIPSISATGDTLEDLIYDLVDAARDYADDWNTSLKSAPNHSENWGFVQVILLSSDEQLASWLVP